MFLQDVACAVRGDLDGRPRQYVDYAIAQTAELAGPRTARNREYWRRHFAGAQGTTRISPDCPGEAADDRGAVLRATLDASVVAGVRRRATAEGTTPFTMMMTAFGLLLHAVTGYTDLVVGTTSAGRPSPDTEEIVGVFVNPLPLRLQLAPESLVRHVLAAVHDVLVDFHEHGHYPLEDLVASVPPFVGTGLNDAFHCYLLYQNYWRPRDEGLVFRPLVLPGVSHHKLMREMEVILDEAPDGLVAEFWYRPTRFSAARVAQWKDGYCEILRRLALDDALDASVATLVRSWAIG